MSRLVGSWAIRVTPCASCQPRVSPQDEKKSLAASCCTSDWSTVLSTVYSFSQETLSLSLGPVPGPCLSLSLGPIAGPCRWALSVPVAGPCRWALSLGSVTSVPGSCLSLSLGPVRCLCQGPNHRLTCNRLCRSCPYEFPSRARDSHMDRRMRFGIGGPGAGRPSAPSPARLTRGNPLRPISMELESLFVPCPATTPPATSAASRRGRGRPPSPPQMHRRRPAARPSTAALRHPHWQRCMGIRRRCRGLPLRWRKWRRP